MDRINVSKRSPGTHPGGALFSRMVLSSIWLLAALALPTFALDPAKSITQFNCQTWTRPNGLPADKVTGISQTRDGYIWLGTQNGLVQFDGREFKPVPVDLPKAFGQDVLFLHRSRKGGFWFCTRNGNFAYFDGREFRPLGDERWNIPDLGPTTVFEQSDGSVWTASYSWLGRWVPSNPHLSFTGLAEPANVFALAEDLEKRVWLGTVESGLFVWKQNRFVPIGDAALRKQVIYALAPDKAGRIWAGTSQGLLCLDRNGNAVFEPVFNSEVKTLLVDSHGVVWFGTTGLGLGRYKDGNITYLSKTEGLAGNTIQSIFEDAEGSIWVGTQDGLSQLSDVKFPILSSKDGICRGTSHTTSVAPDGALWITFSTGATRFDGRNILNLTNRTLFPNIYVKFGYPARNGTLYFVDGDKNIAAVSASGELLTRIICQDWPTAFAEDEQGIVVAMGTVGLFRIRDKELVRYEFKHGAPEFYWVNSMCNSRDGAIWIASNNGIFRIANGEFQHWTPDLGIPMRRAQSIMEDADGSIWAGFSAGIARIRDGKAQAIGRVHGLDDDRVYAIVADDHGSFWLSTGSGILRVSRQMLNAVADGTSRTLHCRLFEGLECIKFNDRTDQEYSGCKTPDGRIWFPNPQGVVMIDPTNYFTNSVAPVVSIQSISVDGEQLRPDAPLELRKSPRKIEIFFSALSYIAPRKLKVRYMLEGFEPDWEDAGSRRSVTYNHLSPGSYTFRVEASNADGVWTTTGAAIPLQFPPPYHQTTAFRLLSATAILLLLFGAYRGKVRVVENRARKLQASNAILEAKVSARTAELATVNESLHSEIEQHKATEQELKLRTESLEREIAERTRMQREVERTHQELVEISRQAGMAEVATGILHNVGNVLNSANVSAGIVRERLKRSKITNVARLATLLGEHAGNLGDFLTKDPKGRRIPSYVEDLAQHLANEQAVALEELANLNNNLEHIKGIIAMQQSYARVSGVTQTIKVVELVEDSLRMNEPSLNRHEVNLTREFEPDLPEITVDKHKVMQILVNLIRNAKVACDDSGRDDKRITVRVHNHPNAVRIAVIDNGVGIPAENLTRIFNHGFTTRKNGHGFGLHSGALAAKELGGLLSVHSDGPGAGATFTLELPKAPKN